MDSAIIETLKSAQTVNVVLIFIKDPMVVYLNKKKDEEITVRVQSMFPNCQKYEPCCKDSGLEETMKKVKKIANYDEMIADILESAKKKKKGYKIKDGEIGDEVNG